MYTLFVPAQERLDRRGGPAEMIIASCFRPWLNFAKVGGKVDGVPSADFSIRFFSFHRGRFGLFSEQVCARQA
jgi:hypothetical protein